MTNAGVPHGEFIHLLLIKTFDCAGAAARPMASFEDCGKVTLPKLSRCECEIVNAVGPLHCGSI
jgi:hypothetical protein